MSTDVQPAASSAAVESLPVPALSSLTSDQRDTWRKTGEFPSADAVAASSAAVPDDQAASTEVLSLPASEPAKPSSGERKKNAESRIQELLADRHARDTRIAALEQQIAERTRPPVADVPPAVSSPATDGAKFPEFAAWAETHPNEAYEDYLDARADFRVDQREQTRSRQRVQDDQRADAERIHETFVERARAAAAADPSYTAKVGPIANQLKSVAMLTPSDPITPAVALGENIVRSDMGPQILLYLSEHPDEFAKLTALTNFDAIGRAIGRLEARFDSSPAVPTVPPKTVTSAPPPPPTLSARASAPVDEIEAALAEGDFARYKAAANARDVASRR